jgi:hypothetical protein
MQSANRAPIPAYKISAVKVLLIGWCNCGAIYMERRGRACVGYIYMERSGMGWIRTFDLRHGNAEC